MRRGSRVSSGVTAGEVPFSTSAVKDMGQLRCVMERHSTLQEGRNLRNPLPDCIQHCL